MKLKEYQNMIYVKLASVTIPDTVISKIRHVAQGLVEDLI
jgi:hypothetical protein